MNKKLTNAEKKQLALSLYITGKHTRKEIAKMATCAEKTLRNWIDIENWDNLKQAKTVTRNSLLADEYFQLAALNAKIKEQGGVINKEQSDAKAVITKNIERLSDSPLHVYVEVLEELLSYMMENHASKSPEYSNIMYEFLQTKTS
jgi:transposase-like protein